MLYQIGIILIIIVAVLIVSKKFSQDKKNDLIFEDEMDEDELKKIDDEIN